VLLPRYRLRVEAQRHAQRVYLHRADGHAT
jgi:hypothetical protein